MAAQFFKKVVPDYTANPNNLYPDLYDNGNTTFDIQVGEVNDVRASKLILADMQLPEKPGYGDAELVGAKVNFFINSIDTGNLAATPAIKAWKLGTKIENREGGASSATMVADTDIAIFSSYVSDDNAVLVEDFEGRTENDDDDTTTRVIGSNVVVQTGPYLTRDVGYDYCETWGRNGNWPYAPISERVHFSRYGTTDETGKEIYKIQLNGNGHHSYKYKSVRKKGNKWVGPGEHARYKAIVRPHIKYTRPLSTSEKIDLRRESGEIISNRVNEKNTFFDFVRREVPIGSLADGKYTNYALADAYFSTDCVLGEGHSMKMHALFPKMSATSQNVYYPQKLGGDLTEQRQTVFVTKQIPTPIRSARNYQGPTNGGKAGSGAGDYDVAPTIEFDINFQKLAPILERNQDSGDYSRTANRCFAITFGKERPDPNDDLFSYVKRHNANSVNGTAIHANAKTLTGLLFINDNGKIKFQPIGRTNYNTSTFVSANLSLDSNTNEIRIRAAPMGSNAFTATDFGLEDSWTRAIFSLKEGSHNMYFALLNPETMEKKADGLIRNIADDGSSSLSLFDEDNAPEYMTMWLQNYPHLHHDTAHMTTGVHNHRTFTGLELHQPINTAQTAIKVRRSDKAFISDLAMKRSTDGEGGLTGGMLDHTSKEYLSLTVGDKFKIGSSDDSEVVTITARSDTEARYTVTRASADQSSNSTTAAEKGGGTDIFVDSYYWNHDDDADTADALGGPGELEAQVKGSAQDMESIIHVDNINFVNFAPMVENATMNVNNLSKGKIRIPKAPLVFTNNQDYGLANNDMGDTTSYPDYTYAKSAMPTYIALGFNQAADVEGGTQKYLMLNGFNCNDLNANGQIYRATNDGTTLTTTQNIRAGFSSQAANEKLGKQVQEAVFDTNTGSPTGSARGLEIGDITTKDDEIGFLSLDSRTVEGFTHKGFMHIKFDADAGDRQATLTQRECIHASCLITKVIDFNKLTVSNSEVFNMKDDETYILYKYNETLDGTGNNKDLKVVARDGNTLTFDRPHGVTAETRNKFLISPKRFWVMLEIMNFSGNTYGVGSIADDETYRYNAEKTYESALLTTGIHTAGVTYAESLYNDGPSVNKRMIDPYNKQEENIIIHDDYGFGDYDEDREAGGHVGIKYLNKNDDVSKYIDIDVSGVVTKDNLKFGDSIPLCFAPHDVNDDYKIVIPTETNTAMGTKPYLLAVMEDPLPKITDFQVKPNLEDPFFADFTWQCSDEDVWYGFMHISDEGIDSQYHGAIMHLPLNDAGIDGTRIASGLTDVNLISVLDAKGDSINDTGLYETRASDSASASICAPNYGVEGLAGNNFTFLGNDVITVGRDANNNFSSITDEMSIVIHATHNTGYFSGGGSGTSEYLLSKKLASLGTNRSLDIFAQSISGTNSAQIIANVYSADGKYVQLRSTTLVPKLRPINIILTFDANLTTSNIKLFIDGKLEDQSGPVISAHATGFNDNTGWVHKANLNSGDSRLYIGSNTVSIASDGWIGSVEEVVIYNKVIYPVNVKSGSFTFTKGLKDVASVISAGEDRSLSKTYSARLFVKDYHNIRGRTKDEVAATAPISYRKAAFNVAGGIV